MIKTLATSTSGLPHAMAGPAIYPNAIILGLFSAIIVLLDLPPFIWHVQRRNLAASSLVFWIILLNFTNFINAIIWPNSDMASRFDGEGLCDIEVKYMVASYAGLPCAVAAILRGLAKVMDPEKVALAPSAAQKRRNLIIDILLVWGCPIYLVAFHYIVQSNRYFIWPVSGCNPSVDNSWLSVVMIFIWPCIFALVDGYYAVLLIIRLYRYRCQFRTILSSHNTTKSRFLRLFIISLICLLGLVPLSFWILAQNLAVSHHAFSWSRVHNPALWNTVIYIDDGGAVLFDRWIRLGAGVLIFAFFGTGQDAVVMYKRWLVKAGLGKIFPSLYQRHDSRRTSSGYTVPWSNWSSKARSIFSSTTSGKHTSTSATHTALTASRNAHSNKDTRASTDSGTTSSHNDDDVTASSPKSDRFFKLGPITAAASSSRPTPSTQASRESIKYSARHSAVGLKADRPYDGLQLEGVSANATGEPAVDGRANAKTENGKGDAEGVLVKKEMWTEKESV